jgi:hypothetical protein
MQRHLSQPICSCLVTKLEDRIIIIANKCFENAEKFKYVGMMLRNQNCIYEEIKNVLNSVNACYHAVQNVLSSWLLSNSIKIKMYKLYFFFFFYVHVKLDLTLREEHS